MRAWRCRPSPRRVRGLRLPEARARSVELSSLPPWGSRTARARIEPGGFTAVSGGLQLRERSGQRELERVGREAGVALVRAFAGDFSLCTFGIPGAPYGQLPV